MSSPPPPDAPDFRPPVHPGPSGVPPVRVFAPQPFSPQSYAWQTLPAQPAPPLGPRPPHRSRGWIVAVVVIGVVVALVVSAVAVGRWLSGLAPVSPTSPASAPPSSSRPSSSPGPRPAPRPQVVGDPVAVEAIDLQGPVSLGTGWNASDGYPKDENLDPYVFLTPCGVLVTVLSVDYSSPRTNAEDEQVSKKARMVGYDIATGTLLWSQNLQEMSGLPIPEVRGYPPTFTPDCRMVFTVTENPWRFPWEEYPPNRNVAIDLRTGEWALLDMGDWALCAAAGTGWAGCWKTKWSQEWYNGGVQPVDLSAPTDPPPWMAENYDAFFGSSWLGDPVAAGRVWSPEGYRDPATGSVVFGSDMVIPEGEGVSPVGYLEPVHVAGWRSGIVVRVDMAGPRGGDATCSFAVWDPEADQTTWAQDGTISCDGIKNDMQWVVAGQVLVVTSHPTVSTPEDWLTRAYAVGDGQFLWEQTGDLDTTSWHSGLGYTTFATKGVSEEYVFFKGPIKLGETSTVIRIRDGVEFRVPTLTGFAPGDTMMYIVRQVRIDGQYQLSLIAQNAQPSQSESSLTEMWTRGFGADADNLWTFVTEGTMYAVTQGPRRETTVIPLAG